MDKINRDDTPTVREILDGDAPFPDAEHAAHNPETGMYEYKDVERPGIDMVKDEASGLFLPPPKQKPVTKLIFDQGLMLDVSEDFDTVITALHTRKPMSDLMLTGPVYGEPVLIKAVAFKTLRVVTTDWRDLEQIEIAQKQNEYNRRMAEAQLQQANSNIAVPTDALPFPFNRQPKRRR